MTLTLVIDGEAHAVIWNGDADSLRAQIQQWMARSEIVGMPLASGSTVLVNWRAVKTAEVR